MKADLQPLKKTNIAEILLTLVLLALLGTMTAAGADLTNIIHLPPKILSYIGGTLLSFVLFGSFLVIFNCVKFMFKKG